MATKEIWEEKALSKVIKASSLLKKWYNVRDNLVINYVGSNYYCVDISALNILVGDIKELTPWYIAEDELIDKWLDLYNSAKPVTIQKELDKNIVELGDEETTIYVNPKYMRIMGKLPMKFYTDGKEKTLVYFYDGDKLKGFVMGLRKDLVDIERSRGIKTETETEEEENN